MTALLAEVAGLVEWPVPLLGRIDAAYMDLPPEVMQVSMRVNQRYFALRTPDGQRRALVRLRRQHRGRRRRRGDHRRQRARAARALRRCAAFLGSGPQDQARGPRAGAR